MAAMFITKREAVWHASNRMCCLQ